MEKECKWFFADQPQGTNETGPNNAMEQSFKQHPYASLIRESIQNSLDAVLDENAPVRMEYTFEELKGAEYANFFELQKHIQGCLDYYPNNKNAKANYKPMLALFSGNTLQEHLGYIRVSDFNTKGMEYQEDKTDSPFYAFVRSAGVSSKESDIAGGSFGFGKAAYYLLSPISTIIVSTRTASGNYFFEGISSLCTHTYNGIKKMPIGYYDNQKGNPICRQEDIPEQFVRRESGTDINILGFNLSDKTEAIKEMIEAVLRNFWLAILRGKLEVTIQGTFISKANLSTLMDDYFPELDDQNKRIGQYNPRPYFEAVYYCENSAKYKKFEESLPILGDVCLYVNKVKGVSDKIIFLRAPLMLVFGRKNKTNHGMYGVFLCESEKGNDILRNMENPAHDEWKPANWKVNGKTFGMGRHAIQELEDFISNALSKLFSQKDKIAINIKGLEEFLYIPTSNDVDDEVDNDAMSGQFTGEYKDEGFSPVSVINERENANVNKPSTQTPTGQVMINRTTTATEIVGGKLRAGHGIKRTRIRNKGIPKPGDIKEPKDEDENGKHGIYATPIELAYRTFCQIENGHFWHYVVLHSDSLIENVRLRFHSALEMSPEGLIISESDYGTVCKTILKDIQLQEGTTKIKVRFEDDTKHALTLSTEEIHEY